MPELPEVEVTRRRILPLLCGRTVARVATTAQGHFFLTPPRRLRELLPGRQIVDVRRHGKHLIAPLDNGWTLYLHLGMTGQLLSSLAVSHRLIPASNTVPSTRATSLRRAPPCFEPDRHTHLILEFDDGGPSVLFRDTRKFGRCALRAPGEVEPRLDKLGPDALVVTGDYLFATTRRRTLDVKSLLLDQTVLAGVGNIYADEALFLAGVRPARRASRLTRSDCAKLSDAIRCVLSEALALGGSSISDFVHPDGSDGGFQARHAVYGRTADPCRTCGATIRRLVTRGRSTHFCPRCQR